LEASLGKTKQG